MAATTGAVASGMGMASCHHEKWSITTKINLFPARVSGMGPTRSTATFCQDRPAYIRSRPPTARSPPDLAFWQISHERTIRLTSAWRPTQYHVIWSRFIVLPTPEWDIWWVCHNVMETGPTLALTIVVAAESISSLVHSIKTGIEPA